MKIVESAQKRNLEQIARNLNSIVGQLKTAVESAAKDGDSFDSVERKTLESVLQIGFHAIELLFALQGDGDLGEEIQGQRLQRRSDCKPAYFWLIAAGHAKLLGIAVERPRSV